MVPTDSLQTRSGFDTTRLVDNRCGTLVLLDLDPKLRTYAALNGVSSFSLSLDHRALSDHLITAHVDHSRSIVADLRLTFLPLLPSCQIYKHESMSSTTPEKDATRGGSKDPFLKSLDALKQVLLIDTPTKRLMDRDVQQRVYEQRETYQKTTSSQRSLIEELRKDLAEFTAKADKERSLRLSLEKAFEQLSENRKELNGRLDEAELANKPLKDKIEALDAEVEKQKTTIREEKAAADKQLNDLATEKEGVLKKQDEVEARLLGARKSNQELQGKLTACEMAHVEEKASAEEKMKGLKSGTHLMGIGIEGFKAANETLSKQVSYL